MSPDLRSRPLSACGLSVRSYNCLTGAGFGNLGDLVMARPEALLSIGGFGVTSLRDVASSLSALGLSFGMMLDSSGVPVLGSGVSPELVVADLVPKDPDLLNDDSENEGLSLGDLLGDSARQLMTKAERYSHHIVPSLLLLLESPLQSIARATLMERADLVRHLANLLQSVLFPSEQPAVLVREISSAAYVASERDSAAATAYYGLDGSAGATLEAIGSGMGISRERVRQLVSRFESRMRVIRPPLPWASAAYACLTSVDTPLSLDEWNLLLPSEMKLRDARMLRMYRQPERWDWLPSSSWLQIGDVWLVLSGGGRESELKAFVQTRRSLLRDSFSWGAAHTDDLAATSGWTRDAVASALVSDPAWKQVSHSWHVRAGGNGGLLGQRTLRILGALGDLNINDIRVGLRRIARKPRRDHPRKRVPPSRVLIALLDQMGLSHCIVSSVIQGVFSPKFEPRGTDAAILSAFSSDKTAITLFELDDVIISHGLSKASARVATSYSPLLRRVEYGIYALVGHPSLDAHVQRARSALLTRMMASLKECVAEPTGIIRLAYENVTDTSRPLSLPYNIVPLGNWLLLEGEGRRVRIHERYMTGMGPVLRRGDAVGRTRVELTFDSNQRTITYQLKPVISTSGQALAPEFYGEGNLVAGKLRILNE